MKTEQASYERRSKEKWADCRQERDFWIMEVVRLEAENARLREATNRNFRFKPQRHSHLSHDHTNCSPCLAAFAQAAPTLSVLHLLWRPKIPC